MTYVMPKRTREQAFSLMCRVKKVPISEEGKIFFDQGRTDYINVDGKQTAIHRWGSGPKKLLFLHGWMSHSQRWRTYVNSLDLSQYTCYAIDAPGHGSSEGTMLNLEIYRQALAQTLDRIEKVDVLVAHSLGNLVTAYQYLYQPDDRVGAYVIMGSPSGMDAIFQYFKDTLGLSRPMLRNLAVKIREVLKINPEHVAMKRFFEQNQSPKLVIHERTDPITPYGPISYAVSQVGGLKLMTTEGLDHTLKSPEVQQEVINFIKEHSKSSAYVLERV